MANDEIIDHLRFQMLRKHFITDAFKADLLYLKPKYAVPRCLVVRDYFLRNRFLRLLIHIQNMLD